MNFTAKVIDHLLDIHLKDLNEKQQRWTKMVWEDAKQQVYLEERASLSSKRCGPEQAKLKAPGCRESDARLAGSDMRSKPPQSY